MCANGSYTSEATQDKTPKYYIHPVTSGRLVRCVPFSYVGDTPYPGYKGRDVGGLLENGYRMTKPGHLSKNL